MPPTARSSPSCTPDRFLTHLPASLDVRPYAHPIYVCSDCGCHFLPDISDASAVYPDRAVPIGMFGAAGCSDDDCPCHALPYEIPSPPGAEGGLPAQL